MSNIWFTSDTHFGHKNILKYCPDSRPYSSIEEMDEAIIENWNERVKPGDVSYHIGDVTWYRDDKAKQVLSRLNGQNNLVMGNHDNFKTMRECFLTIRDYYELKIDKQTSIVLFHFPIYHWNK